MTGNHTGLVRKARHVYAAGLALQLACGKCTIELRATDSGNQVGPAGYTAESQQR